MRCALILLALATGPGAALAQGFPQNPGMSPTQERLLNPIPLPVPGLAPSPPVPMIVSPAPVVSTPPPLTAFPSGSGPAVDPIDRRMRTPTVPDFTAQGRSPAGTDSEAAARAAIEADGYRRVTGLKKTFDGLWHGKALRGQTEIGVSVDARGNVSAE